MDDAQPTAPYGYCQCGCGLKPQISRTTSRYHGYVKGEPRRFVKGHNGRRRERYRIEDCGYVTPCWTWTGSLTRDGYGEDWWGNKKHRAHRLAWERANGPIPDGMVPDHLCQNRACVNPAHMEIVTPLENRRRGRDIKLTPAKVRALRQQWAEGVSRATLASRFGLTPGHLSAVVLGTIWKDV